jgi:hypothetical protein
MPVYGVYTAASPFNAVDLPDTDFEQTADVIYLAHLDHNPTKIIRHDHTDWEFQEVPFGPTIAAPTGIGGTATTPNTDSANSGNAYFPQPATYLVTAFDQDTGQESRPSATVALTNDLSLKRNYNTITWSAVTGASSYRVYKANNQQSYGFIGETTSLTFRDDNIGPDLSTGIPVAFNPFTGDGDKPSTVTFHEQRAWYGRSRNRPDGLWGSRSADYENMDYSRPGQADDQITIGLVANKVNSVNHVLSSEQGLLALTSNNIFVVQGANDDYIAATPPPRVRPKVRRGASRLRPITIDGVVIYQTLRSEIRVVSPDPNQINDGLRTDDITIFSRHLFEGRTVVSWAYSEKPSSCVYAVLDNGQCLCMTWDEAQQVWGWTVLETDGQFLKVAIIFEENEDRAYFLVKRTINGADRYYWERTATELWTDQVDCCFLDCARSWINDTPITTFDRLDFLEGKTVYAWVDGSVVKTDPAGQPLVVTNGGVTLAVGGLTVTIGLPFTAEIETLPLAIQTGSGWSVAKPQEAEKAILRLVNSRNVKAGINADSLFEIKQREDEDFNDPIALFTGDKEIELDGVAGSDGTSVFIRSDDPVPLHVAAVLIEPKFGNMN